MNKEFLINVFFLISINLIIKPFYIFGIDLQVQNLVGKEAYGLYFALFNFSYIFQILTDLGIQQYNNKNIAQHDYLLDKYFSSLVLLKGGLSLVFLIAAYAAALLIGYRGFSLYLLVFLLCNQIFITFTFFFRSNISGLQHYRLDSFLSIVDKLLLIVICLPLIYTLGNQLRIEYFVYAQCIAFGLTTIIAFIACYRLLNQPLKLQWNWALVVSLLKQSFPFALVVLLMTLYARVDAVMVERLLPNGKEEAGIYAAGYRLLDAANMVCFLFAGLLLPMFARLLKQQDSILPLLGLSSRIILVITISFSTAVSFHALDIVQFLYPEDWTPYMASVLVLLMIGFNAIGLIQIIGTLLTANANLKQMNIVFMVGIGINVVSNYFLILSYGAWGAALTTVLTQGFVAIAELELARRAFSLQVSWKLLGQLSAFVIGIILLNYTIRLLELPWMMEFVGAGFFSVLLSILFGLISPQRILKLFNRKST